MDIEDLIVDIYRLLVFRENSDPETKQAFDEHPDLVLVKEYLDQQTVFTDCSSMD